MKLAPWIIWVPDAIATNGLLSCLCAFLIAFSSVLSLYRRTGSLPW